MMAEYFIFFDIDFGDRGAGYLEPKAWPVLVLSREILFLAAGRKSGGANNDSMKDMADRNRFIYTIKIIKWIKKYNIQEVCLYII